jgi:hypothetical protein
VHDAGSGLIKKQGFKGALREGGTSAKVATIKNLKLLECVFNKNSKTGALHWFSCFEFMFLNWLGISLQDALPLVRSIPN